MINNQLAATLPSLIFNFRGQKVMVDIHLSLLYEVETRTLKQAVKRNIERFPEDFMFELNREEIHLLVTQNVIPNKKQLGGAKPMVFTEQGVAMLSSVLRSEKSVQINIEIMRAFARYRAVLLDNQTLRTELMALDDRITQVFRFLLEKIDAMQNRNAKRTIVGFKPPKV
ncbi:MAG: ORF6N domain-containing protein [Bacteroidia bacterium]|nr:ORF6N domain-containing protein [Bacteroidia bacterium]